MPVRIDFSNVQTFEPVPAGVYYVEIKECEQKTSEKSGNDYFNWKFEIIDGEFEGRKVFGMTSLVEKALFSLKGLLAAIGEPCEGEIEFEPEDMIGKQLKIKVTVTKYEGRDQNSIGGYYSLND